MDEPLLRPVSTRSFVTGGREKRPQAAAVDTRRVPGNRPGGEAGGPAPAVAASSDYDHDDVLQILRGQPDHDDLVAALRRLAVEPPAAPSPRAASIVRVLATDIAPTYWPLLRDGGGGGGGGDAELLLAPLRGVAGLNALVARARALLAERDRRGRGRAVDVALNLDVVLDLLAALLAGDDAVRALWAASAAALPDPTARRAQSQQLVALLASGRVLSAAAEASAVVAGTATPWVADAVEYSRWIGRNLASWALARPSDDQRAFCFDVFQRAMSLGYPGALVRTIVDRLLLSKACQPDAFVALCFHQPRASKKVFDTLLDYLAQRFLDGLSLADAASNATVAAVAGVIDVVAGRDDGRKALLIGWCTAPSGAGLGHGVGIRRAVLAALAGDKESIATVLDKGLAQFGDQLYIKHAAMLQQEVHAQVLLLGAGYVARLAPVKLAMLLKRGTYMSAISNRIAATQARSRLLGMAIGEALSALVHKEATRLDFGMDETEADDVGWLKGLVQTADDVGPPDLVVSAEAPSPPPVPVAAKAKPRAEAPPRPVASAARRAPVIEEVDTSDADDDDLAPYAKGSDPDDSEDDATLVRRDKVKAPVYVRDLVAYLRDSESYDKQRLGLQAAPALLRRKANFGTEVSAHAEELAGLLVGLQDKFALDGFVEARQQATIALVVAQPESMAPWFARVFFEGDLSLAQRTSVLVTLGLAAREVGGHEAPEHAAAASFPSRRLPATMEQLYLDAPEAPPPSRLKALPAAALEAAARSLTASFLGPLAAEAADAASGPDALKLRTFRRRHDEGQGRARRQRARAAANPGAALLATHFFAPLTAHLQAALGSGRPAAGDAGLLSLYLQTLGVVVHAAGPSTPGLRQVTAELWALLLRVRAQAAGDVAATRGWLVAATALLDVNEGDMRRLCEEHGRDVVETRAWAADVVTRTRGGDGGEEHEVKTLAAGVVVRLGEAVETHRALLLGDLAGGPW